MSAVTKPIALDETLQRVATALEKIAEGGGGGGGLSADAITALLACFEHVVWDTANGSTFYNNLYNALVGTSYTVTYSLTGCTSSNDATTIAEGESYSTTITADAGKTLDSVICTMGGESQTVTGGSISIASVTGNIVITASASVHSAHTGYDSVGNPSISDGIFTPSEGNYIVSNCSFAMSEYDSWEFVTRVYNTNLSPNFQDLALSVDTNYDRVRALQIEGTTRGTDKCYGLFAGNNTTSWNICSGRPAPYSYANAWRFIKIGFDGAKYYAYYSDDGGVTWGGYDDISSTSKIMDFDMLAIGKKQTEVFVGQIDLNETKFYVDGNLYWEAIA